MSLTSISVLVSAAYIASFTTLLTISTSSNIKFCIPSVIRIGHWVATDPHHACHELVKIGTTTVQNECHMQYTTFNSTTTDGIALLHQISFIPFLFLLSTLIQPSIHITNVKLGYNTIRWISNSITDALVIVLMYALFGIEDQIILLSGALLLVIANIIHIAREYNDGSWRGQYMIQFISTMIHIITWFPIIYSYHLASDILPFMLQNIFMIFIITETIRQTFQVLNTLKAISGTDGEHIHLLITMISRLGISWITFMFLLNTEDASIGRCA